MNQHAITALVATATLLLGLLCGALLGRATAPTPAPSKVVFDGDPSLTVIPAAELYAACKVDPDRFFRRFVSVIGVVTTNGWKSSEVTLKLDAGEWRSISCDFSEGERSRIEGLQPGTIVTVRGWCSHGVSDGSANLPGYLSLEMCNVEKVPDGTDGFNLAP